MRDALLVLVVLFLSDDPRRRSQAAYLATVCVCLGQRQLQLVVRPRVGVDHQRLHGASLPLLHHKVPAAPPYLFPPLIFCSGCRRGPLTAFSTSTQCRQARDSGVGWDRAALHFNKLQITPTLPCPALPYPALGGMKLFHKSNCYRGTQQSATSTAARVSW